MRTAVRVAQEVGAGLGERGLLLGCVPEEAIAAKVAKVVHRVIPVEAGNQKPERQPVWTPACAGVTDSGKRRAKVTKVTPSSHVRVRAGARERMITMRRSVTGAALRSPTLQAGQTAADKEGRRYLSGSRECVRRLTIAFAGCLHSDVQRSPVQQLGERNSVPRVHSMARHADKALRPFPANRTSDRLHATMSGIAAYCALMLALPRSYMFVQHVQSCARLPLADRAQLDLMVQVKLTALDAHPRRWRLGISSDHSLPLGSGC